MIKKTKLRGMDAYCGTATHMRIYGIDCIIVCNTADDLSEFLRKVDFYNFDEAKFKDVGVVKGKK